MEQEKVVEGPAATRSRGAAVPCLQVALLIALLGCMPLQWTHAASPRLEPQLAPSDSAGLAAAQHGTGYVANLGYAGEVSLWRWDADRKRLSRVLTLRDAASAVRLTNDDGAEEPLLAVGTHYGEIKLYDTSGQLLCRSQVPQVADIVQLEASRAQNVIVAADSMGAVHVWDAQCKGRKLNAYKHDRLVTNLVLHKNIAVTVSHDGTLGAIALTDVEPLPLMPFSGEESYSISALSLAEDGHRIALGGSDNLYLFEVEQLEQLFRSGQKPKLLAKVGVSVKAVAILRPGDRLLYQDMFGGLFLRNLRTGENRQLRPEGTVSQFAVAADGTTVYVAPSDSRALQVFRLGFTQAGPPVRLSTTEAIRGIAIAQGRVVAATARGKIRFLNEDGIVESGGGDVGEAVHAFAMSRDGSTIALAGSGIWIKVLDAKTLAAKTYKYGKLVKRVSGNFITNMQTTALDFFPDGKSFAATSTFGFVSLWDLGKTEPVHEDTADSPARLRVSPDGQRIAVSSGDVLHDNNKRIIVANFKDRKDRFEIPESHGRTLVSSIAFSVKGDRLVTVGWDDRVKIWDANGGKLIEQFAMDNPVGIQEAHFIEGDQALLLLMQDGSVAVLDRKAGAPLQLRYRSDASAWAGERLEAEKTAVSPDGSVAAVGTRNGSVLIWRQGLQLLAEVRSPSVHLYTMAIRSSYLVCGKSNLVPMCWDLQRGLLPVPAQAENGGVESIAPSPRGSAIAAIRQAGYVTVWPVDSPTRAVTIQTDGISGWLRWSLDGSTVYLVGARHGADIVTRLAVASDGASVKAMPPWKAQGGISGLYPLDGGGIGVEVGSEILVLDASLQETERIAKPERCGQGLRFQPVSFLSQDLVAYSCDESVLVMKREASGWLQVLARETFGIASAFAFDPKQNLLVSGHRSGDLNFWDLQTGKLAAGLSVGQPIQAMSVRGGMLVVGTADGQLLFYRLSDRAELGWAILNAEGAMVLSADGWYGVSGNPALQLIGLESSKESGWESISSRNSMATVNTVLLERDRWTVRAREMLARQAAFAKAKFASLSFLEQLGVIVVALYLALFLAMAAAWVLAPARLFVWSLKLSSSWTISSMNRLQGST